MKYYVCDDGSISISESKSNVEKPSLRRRMLEYFCGFSTEDDGITEAEKEELENKMRMLSMSENPKWRTLVNIGGLIAFSLGIFLWGYLF
jgi:hypothetical protein